MQEPPLKRPELRQQIGTGWLGDVHAAGVGPDGTPLAVRTLAAERVADVGRLAQQLSFAARHEHQHVLPVTMPGSDGGNVFYLMPQALGGSLRDVFQRYRAAGAQVDVDTMLDVARQVAEGLDFAHAHGTLHGNLKPENVLLQPLPAPKQDEFNLLLSDFGLNQLRQPESRSPYLPASQRAGAAATLETDLYSLGALIFEGVMGQALPAHPELGDLANVPEPAAKIVGRCLGLSAPFADVSAFLGYLKAVQTVRQTGADVQFSADHSYLDVVPGEGHQVQLRLRSEQVSQVQVLVEGLPPAWAPQLPPIPLQPWKESTVSLTFQVPKRSSVRAGLHVASIVVLANDPGAAQEPAQPVEVGRVPLQLRVQPFDASQLRLSALQAQVGGSAAITATLRNEGNQTQRYNLEVTLPAGSMVRAGSLRRQFELAPGAEFSELVDVRLPAAGLGRRELTFTALANSVPRPTAAELADGLPPTESWPPVYNTVRDHLKLEQRPLVPWWALALGLAGLLSAGAWAIRPPHIESFSLDGRPPMQGEPFTLAWRTTGARQVRIAELPDQAVDTSGQLRLPGVKGPRTYTLVVTGLLTQQKQQLSVTPTRPAPRIDVFRVTPASAKLGETVRVDWNVVNAQKVSLQPFGAVPASGHREFRMQRDTTLRLAGQQGAEPSREDVSSAQTVVLSAPEIKVFEITPPHALRGQNVTVRWEVGGASRVRLSPLGDLPASGTRTFPASQTANYTLKASNGQVEKTASASLTVRVPQASIEAVTVTPTNPLVGQPVKVQWRTREASRAELRWGNQRQTVAASGSLTITAGRDLQSVTLVAENPNGVPAMTTRPVQVRLPAPAVTATTGMPSQSTPSQVAVPPPTTTSPPPSTGASRPGSPSPAPSRTATAGPASTVTTTPKSAPASSATPTTKAVPSNSASVRPPASTASRQTPPAPAVKVQTFSYRPATRAGARPTLTWAVSGVTRVRISGLSGPNSDGTFPAKGSVSLSANARPGSYTLTARNGAVRATVLVPATAVTSGSSFSGSRPPSSTTPTAPTRPTTPAPASTASRSTRPARPTAAANTPDYPEISGAWNHTFGQMNLVVTGNRVSGALLSSRADLPSGDLRGTLSGSPSNPTMNAYVVGDGEKVALIVRFDQAAHTFDGLYSSRSARVPWCGWKSPGANPCP